MGHVQQRATESGNTYEGEDANADIGLDSCLFEKRQTDLDFQLTLIL